MTQSEHDDRGPSETSEPGLSLFAELGKRRVYQSAVAYAVVAWGVTEILEGVIDGLGWPDWLATLAVILFVTGFPVAMFLAWVYDWTPEGIRRTTSSGPLGWLPAILAGAFLVAGSAALFWLINPSGVVRAERIGVAMLPCRYRGDPAFEFRGEGVAQVLNERLSYSGKLRVPTFDATLAVSAAHPQTKSLAGRLGVDFLVDCRVAEDEDRVQLAVSLVDIDSDESRELATVRLKSIEILDALRTAEQVITRSLGLPPEERQEYGAFTPSLEAFDEFLQGLWAMRVGTAEALEEARERFGEARSAGPFTLARVYEVEAILARLEIDPPPESSRPAALRAVGLILDEIEQGDSNPAELYAARLRLANLADRFEAATSADDEQRRDWFERATSLRPSFAEAYRLYADYLERTGRIDAATELRQEAAPFEPSH